MDEMVRWLQPSCCHGNQAACQTHSQERARFPAPELHFPACKAPAGMKETHPLPGSSLEGAGRTQSRTPPTPTPAKAGHVSGCIWVWRRTGNHFSLMTYLTDKEVNGYKKGQRLRIDTCPGFVTDSSVVLIESILSRSVHYSPSLPLP